MKLFFRRKKKIKCDQWVSNSLSSHILDTHINTSLGGWIGMRYSYITHSCLQHDSQSFIASMIQHSLFKTLRIQKESPSVQQQQWITFSCGIVLCMSVFSCVVIVIVYHHGYRQASCLLLPDFTIYLMDKNTECHEANNKAVNIICYFRYLNSSMLICKLPLLTVSM